MILPILSSFLPEVFLSICILFQLVSNAFTITHLPHNFPIMDEESFAQSFFILLCLLCLLFNNKIEGFLHNFLLSSDLGTNYVKISLVSSGLVCLPIVLRSFRLQKLNFSEYFTMFLLSILSLLLLISSSDMITAYLVIELQALSFYVLGCFKRNSAYTADAGIKYFISGSLISGIFLFGCSLIYGTFGTLNFHHLMLISVLPMSSDLYLLSRFALVGVLMVTITLLFKLSVAPFHFWTPDVYEGAPLASTIIFSIIPKFAIFYFFIKWLSIISLGFPEVLTLLLLCGIASAFVGTFLALSQRRLKRLIIYSSIAQTGFLVAALSSIQLNNIIAIHFFLVIYVLTSVLLWSHFSLLYSSQKKISVFYDRLSTPLFLSSIANFFKINKLWSFSFLVIFFSVAGIPPLSGFLAKLLILLSLIESNKIFGSIALVGISIVSTFYYLKVIKSVFFESKINTLKSENSQVIFSTSYLFEDCLLISTLLFCLVFFFFYPSMLLSASQCVALSSYYF